MNPNGEPAHESIDRLPEMQLSGPISLLGKIVDPAAAALRNAPIDDEPENEEEQQEVAQGREWFQRNGGKGVPHEEAMGGSASTDGDRVERDGVGRHVSAG
jgi:hypothetical protein